MSDINSDLQNELDGIEHEIKIAKDRLPDYTKRQFINTQREKSLLYCLGRAAELAEGCILCARTKLLAPQYLLTRGLFESLIWVCWITKSDENAQAFNDATKNELKRLARKELNKGYGRVINTTTHKDVTEELLNSDWSKDILSRLKIEDAATDAGLEKLYTEMYGFMSIPAHGIMLDTNSSLEEDMTAILAVANVLMESINLVAKNWVDNRNQTPIQDIYSILQI